MHPAPVAADLSWRYSVSTAGGCNKCASAVIQWLSETTLMCNGKQKLMATALRKRGRDRLEMTASWLTPVPFKVVLSAYVYFLYSAVSSYQAPSLLSASFFFFCTSSSVFFIHWFKVQPKQKLKQFHLKKAVFMTCISFKLSLAHSKKN